MFSIKFLNSPPYSHSMEGCWDWTLLLKGDCKTVPSLLSMMQVWRAEVHLQLDSVRKQETQQVCNQLESKKIVYDVLGIHLETMREYKGP